ncbi:hypothetical protein LTR36_000707 [Oleoguttula mirabilis]|uniref:Uncharacterized protein n=1 Tax=Oleoguttula mirabilis TaxID=1507867 RepID=A0AAV9JQV8_9PEZI|nr:hypothetical protein LTR36_000707 [Oleoguttula mirabilis]
MSSYFSLPSFARAKKNKESLEKKNPQKPVLNDEDEQFLQKQISHDATPQAVKNLPPTTITESGEEKEASKEETEQAGAGADQVIVPEKQPETGDGAQESKPDDDATESKPDDAAPESKQHDAASESKKEDGPPEPKHDDAESKTKKEDAALESKQDDAASEAKEDDAMIEAKQEDAGPDPKEGGEAEESVDDPPEQAPEESMGKAEPTSEKSKKTKKDKSFELPSQEEAEAATKGFNVDGSAKAEKPDAQQGEKRTWTSYLPSIGTSGKKDQTGDKQAATSDKKDSTGDKEVQTSDEKVQTNEDKPAEEAKEGESSEQSPQRTWAGYASSAYSSLPSMPSLPNWRSKDGNAESVYNEDGTVNEQKTKEKQESEVSVLLDKLDMSSINNRVFAFSGETQKIYERFAVVLKDTMNGGPTAYEDMETLMKDAGPQLEKQFASMPPFVQTLVKSLPAKFGSTLGPELLAAASQKPGADMQARMTAASKQKSSGDSSISAADTSEKGGEDGEKKKRKIPGLKGLVSKQGMTASILRSVVTFIQTRFPFLASSMNVVMSLSVFILMFVFWYCHKRGKEARLAREAEAGKNGETVGEDEDGEFEAEVTDEEEGAAEEKAEGGPAESEPDSAAKQEDSAEAVSETAEKAKEDALDKSEPSKETPPDEEKGEKSAETAAEKITA